jgi:RNA polymerase sigma-70 factor (ECF subfamily)
MGPARDDTSETDDGTDLAARSRSLRGALARYFRRRLPDANEVDDLVQEVFLRIVRRGNSQDLDRFEGYAFETAASVIKDRFRRRRVRMSASHVAFEPDLHGQTDVSPEQTVLAREALRSTTRAIMALPERTRTIFILRRLEGLSHPEIARRLGLSLSTVEKHIQRAAKHLLSLGEDTP